MQQYTRLFKTRFWDTQVWRFGFDAMKFTQEVIPAVFEYERFEWKHVVDRFGLAASDWMEHTWERLKDESECQMLWRWLYYKMVLAVEPNTVLALWQFIRGWWDFEDRYAWQVGDGVATRYTAMVAAIDKARGGPPGPDGGFPDIPGRWYLSSR